MSKIRLSNLDDKLAEQLTAIIEAGTSGGNTGSNIQVSNNTTDTEEDGKALNSVQANEEVDGTLARRIRNLEDSQVIPITRLSELDNDTGFITNLVDNLINYYTKEDTFSKEEITALLSELKAGIDVKMVESLPMEDISNKTIYLLPTDDETIFVQWMYLGEAWVSFGNTTLNLDNYYTIKQIDSKLLGYVTSTALEIALNEYAKRTDLSDVAFSGKYNDLDGLPTIPEIMNSEILSKFSEVDGEPYYDGKPITSQGSSSGGVSNYNELVNLPKINNKEISEEHDGDYYGLMDKDVFASTQNEGSVKNADVAKHLEYLADNTDPFTYAGHNSQGIEGAYPLPIGIPDESKIQKREFNDITVGWEKPIESRYALNDKAIISVKKLVKESTSVDITIKNFNTDNEAIFNHTENVLIENDGTSINKSYEEIPVVNTDGFFEIDLSAFKIINKCEVIN